MLVDSAVIDPYVQVTYPDARFGHFVEDNDSGGGLFGLNADLTFRAPHSDLFTVVVGDFTGRNVGGYSLAVSKSRGDAPPPISLPPTPTPIITQYGHMQHYRSDHYPFTMLVPETWNDVTEFDESCYGTCFAGDDAFLTVSEEDVEAQWSDQGSTMTRQQYDAIVRQGVTSLLPGATLQARQSLVTESGVTVEIAHYRWNEGGMVFHMKLLIAFEDGIGFSAIYMASDEAYGQLEEMIDYSFSTVATE